MMKTIIAMTFALISTFGFSQNITLSTKLIYGKDTILLKKGQSIASVLDSLNEKRLASYYVEQQRIEDSTQSAYDERIKKGPHLYYHSKNEEGRLYIETEFDPEIVTKIIDSLKFQKIDSVITYSDMAYEVLNEINSARTQKLETDSMRQEMFSEDMLYTYYLKKDVALLQKDHYDKCMEECYKLVFDRISRKKKLMRALLSENIEYISLSIVEDRRSVTAFISYKEKNIEKYYYKIVYIR
jgi:hypothetical protein